jgi:micrococcal nuclease
MENAMYVYRAALLRVVDGDTVDVAVDLGFNITIKQRVRLEGVNTPELNSSDREERSKAVQARALVEECLRENRLELHTFKPYPTDKYGRYLARIFFKSGDDLRSLGDLLLERGLAQVYNG